MSSYTLGAFIEHESASPAIKTPPSAIAKGRQVPLTQPATYELDDLQWGSKLDGPSTGPQFSSGPATPRELEHSTPSTPRLAQPAEIVQTIFNPPMNKWRAASAGFTFFIAGMNDSASGALIPYIENQYSIGYAIVSLIFITNAVGFISAAPLVDKIQHHWGRARAYMLATTVMCAGYTMIVASAQFKVAFPVVVVSFLLLGFGLAIILAMNNVFIVSLANATVILGFMHGFYGVGGTVAPLMATAMATNGVRWQYFYLIPLSIALINIPFLGWSFWSYEKESQVQYLAEIERTASRRAVELGQPKKNEILKRALRNRTTLLGAFFIFAYQGAEVSVSGWVISFLITTRQGDPAHVGYVTSGFWAGITIGRFILVRPLAKMGPKASTVTLIIGSAAFQLLIWLVPNIIGDAVAVAILGLFLGPVYPLATGVFSKLLPRNIQMSSLGFVASMGSSGGAFAPFVTGLVAQQVGTFVLNPICIGLYAVMEIAWLLLPKEDKRMA